MICKSAKALLVLFLLSFLVSEVRTEAELVVTASCMNCTLNCPTGKCLRVSGGNFTKEICSTLSSCYSIYLSYKLGITLCSTNQYGVKCQDSLCYYHKNRTAACQPGFPPESCVRAITYSQSCSTSCSTSPCQACQKLYSSVQGESQYCFNNGCGYYTDRFTTRSACPNGTDQDGISCSCCMNQAFEPHRLCLKYNITDTQFINYAKAYLANANANNSTNNSTSSGNWESIARIWVGVAVAFIAALAF